MFYTKKNNRKGYTKSFAYTLLASSLLTACQSNPEIHITGTVRNLTEGKIVYLKSTDGMFNSKTSDTLQIQPDSTFSLTLPARQYERLTFIWLGRSMLGSVFSKGGEVRVDIDASAQKPLTIEGNDAKTVQLTQTLNQLDADVWDLRARKGDRWQIANDTVATSVSQKLKNYATSLEKQLEGVDKELQSKARQDIRMQLLLAFQNQTMATCFRSSEATKQAWFAELDKMTEFGNINHPDSPFSPAFYDVASNEAGIHNFMRNDKHPESNEQVANIIFDHYAHTLEGKAQETAMALLVLEDQERENYNPNIPALAERFVQLHPQSPWLPQIQEAVEKNQTFNSTTISDELHFPDVSNAKTFKDITEMYKGKVIFMDIWATWCAPCRESFAYVQPLQEYAKEHDIVLLYLSIDRPEEKDKWKKMAAHYNLKGEHILVQEAFKQEIYDTFGNKGALYIPHCVIFGKDGKVRYKVAASPEKMDELKKQLEEAGK